MSACRMLWSFGFSLKRSQVTPAGLCDGNGSERGRFGAQDSRAQCNGLEAGDVCVFIFAFAESPFRTDQEAKLRCRWRD